MQHRHTFPGFHLILLCTLSVGTVLSGPHLSWAIQTPLATIRTTVEQAEAVLNDPAYQGADNFQKRIKKLETIILPRLDRNGFAQRCLGPHWQQLNDSQRKHFVTLFTELLELSYGGMLDRYPGKMEFEYDSERIEGEYAQVSTRVLAQGHDKPFAIDYRLRQLKGKWLIYDVVGENVSMVRNFRTQFNRVIGKSGYDGLVQALERKLVELRKSPSSS